MAINSKAFIFQMFSDTWLTSSLTAHDERKDTKKDFLSNRRPLNRQNGNTIDNIDFKSGHDLLKLEKVSWIQKTRVFVSDVASDAIKESNDKCISTRTAPSPSFLVGPISVSIRFGSLVGVLGGVASGKSSFLLGILDEIQTAEMNEDSKVTAKNGLTITYCAQIPSIHNLTLRENVVMGAPFDSRFVKSSFKIVCDLYP
jgi:ABC-type uncharacterized transport system fused permease/ATPase subunit